ncbi:hypothetical protein BG011_005389 [Mortierella polycephala]|uniref:Uncharacterized protein n=1 Tax=Mortierella polycephala TaxID=41804 RepID=A0A9P6PVL4_9FUNG|nr:hypothetical protein BG011_005389 [Mortierella polycephala]
MYNEVLSDVEREALTYRDILIGLYSSGDTDQGRMMGARHGSSGHSSPVLNASETSQQSIPYQHHSNSSGTNSRGIDHMLNSTTLSPTYNHLLQHQGSFIGRDEQSAANHVVLYTILKELCNLRMALIGIYRLMSLSTVGIDIPKILPETEKAQQMYDSGTLELRNTVLGEGIEYEIRVLRHCLLMDKAIAEYDIQKSATHLHLAKASLLEWQRISSEQEYSDKSHHKHEETSWRYNLFSGGEDKTKASVKGKFNLLPSHLLWLHRWIASERSKMTIYFMNILLEKERTLGGDERSLWANMDPDMHGIYPPDPPRDHWPNIISIMQGSASILHQFRSQYFYDRKIGCTYYVARVDSHVSIVIIYLDRHPQPDTGAMDFLQLLAGKLRHTDVLSAMRQE